MKCFRLSLVMIALWAAACSANEEIPEEMKGLISLLIMSQAPTEADFSRFYGPSAEDEVQMLLNECSKKGITRDDCVKKNNDEALNPDSHPSRYFAWIRHCYDTVGAKWKIRGQEAIRNASGAVIGSVYEVDVNSARFKIHFSGPAYRYDGLAVAIFQINGVDTKQLISQGDSHCVAN